MKFRSLKVFVALLFLLAACSVPIEEEERDGGITRQALEDLDERGTWTLWQWYIEQGFAPCDPPPDPWHPFIKYGYCGVDGEAEHEAVPNESFDDP